MAFLAMPQDIVDLWHHVDRVEDSVPFHILLRLLEVAVQSHGAEVHVLLGHVECTEQSKRSDHLRIDRIVAGGRGLRQICEQLVLL